MNPKNFDITTLFKRMSLDQLQEMRKNMVDQLSALDEYLIDNYPVCDLGKSIVDLYPDLLSTEVTE